MPRRGKFQRNQERCRVESLAFGIAKIIALTQLDLLGATVSSPSFPLLRDHQSSGRGQQHYGDQAFLLHAQGGFAHGFQMRTRVLHENKAVVIALGTKMAYPRFAHLPPTAADTTTNSPAD